MHELARGVCLVTVATGGQSVGLTATSVSQLSGDPPALLVCINRTSSVYSALARSSGFAVNILAADQRDVADRFIDSSDDKGADQLPGGEWLPLPSGAVCLADALAIFDCELEERIERHTHAIVIGRVRRVLAGAGSGALVRWRRAYDQVGWSQDEISRATGLSPRSDAR